MMCVTLAANITSAFVSANSSNQRFFLKFEKHAQSVRLIIVQLLGKYFTLLFFKSFLPVAMTHYLDLWHLKTVKTAIFIT
jgi:hypothetical protein